MKHLEQNKKYELDTEHVGHRYNAALYLTNRQVSWLTVSIVLCVFFVFVTGYFLGQRKAMEQLSHIQEADLYQDFAAQTHMQEQQQAVVQETQPIEQMQSEAQQYYAQLIGFGTSRAAERFVDRLQQKNVPVKVIERHSKTAQGKKIIWYQVVTERFSDRDDLVAFTQKIEKEERLNDIRIVSC